MRRYLSLLATTMLVCAAAALLAGPAGAAPNRFDIGIQDPMEFAEADQAGAFDVLSGNGVRYVRVGALWVNLAPTRPANPTNPNDPAYQWASLDARLNRVWQRGLTPIVVLYTVPRWALRGSKLHTVQVGAYGQFAKALARRYSGGDRPRIKNWEQWNEPNFRAFLDEKPQHYRSMINAGYASIHSVRNDNVVAAGSLAPFTNKDSISPFKYMRAVLCMSRGKRPKPTCKSKASFDAWTHHPYTSGGPNHSARNPDDAALGDLPEMARLVRAAHKARHVKSRGRPGLWITEFGWDTNGPDPGGVPVKRHARWVAEAMYRMWQSDVSLMVWFQLRDVRPSGNNWGGTFQQGIYYNTTPLYRNERTKPVAQVLRFPFVALPEGKRVAVWGRTPGGKTGRVVIEVFKGGKWARSKTVRTNSRGLFRLRFAGRKGATFRARLGTQSSYPFQASKTRDVRVNPFGGGSGTGGGGGGGGSGGGGSGGGNPPPGGGSGNPPPPPDPGCVPIPLLPCP